VSTVDPTSRLRNLRNSIDNIDAAIVHMLAERFRVTQAVGELKAQHGLPPRDSQREADQVSRVHPASRGSPSAVSRGNACNQLVEGTCLVANKRIFDANRVNRHWQPQSY
jgi:chorismate mutase